MKEALTTISTVEVKLDFKQLQLQPTKLLSSVCKQGVSAILFLTSYPPRECGIATYSQDLVQALNIKFNQSFCSIVCPLESSTEQHQYTSDITYKLNVDEPLAFLKLARKINKDDQIKIVVIQHEFGFFEHFTGNFKQFLTALEKPVIIVFHTVLPLPSETLKWKVQRIAAIANSIIVMTKNASIILQKDYDVSIHKISIIPHGTHLVANENKDFLKSKYNLSSKKILSTFGLLSSGKSIETTLFALPEIIKTHPDVCFLIIGKTHPNVIKNEQEKYRNFLEKIVIDLHLQNNVIFINQFLPLPILLEYLQLSDIYLFTSKNPNQAVSGTFSYALSSGCPIVSTPIPHACEVLVHKTGIIIDFENSNQLANAVIHLLDNNALRKEISSNALHKMASTAWENTAIAHAILFQKVQHQYAALQYSIPVINLSHLQKMTTTFGIIQFAIINQPDITSGFTLDDNARAMVAMCQYFQISNDTSVIPQISIYLQFIQFCLQKEGFFLNYVDDQKKFTNQNFTTNLADSNGRAIWGLGYLLSLSHQLPNHFVTIAQTTMQKALLKVNSVHSTRAMAFVIKGLYYRNKQMNSVNDTDVLTHLSDRLVQMYKHEATKDWMWFESYLTYANSILPEAMLCAWLCTGNIVYKNIAKQSFDFLLSKIFTSNSIQVISNKGWLHKNNVIEQLVIGGEQPIDVAYTVIALSKFYDALGDVDYYNKMQIAFSWFLGNNHLHQIIYNPCTGGCYDGLEENYVNLNQGAESTASYLMARLTIEKYHHHTVQKQLNQHLQFV